MSNPLTKSSGNPARFADPDEIVRAREAAGWSRDQFAEAVGALPVEVAAWESGANRLTLHEADVVRWKIAWALHEQAHRPPSDCAWMARHRDRLNLYLQTGVDGATHAERALAEHRGRCDTCRAAYGATGKPSPLPPVAPGPGGWIERGKRVVARWPTWLRVPAKAALVSLGVAACGAFGHLLALIKDPDVTTTFPSPELYWGMGYAGYGALAIRLFRGLGRRRPRLAGFTCAVAIVLPAVLMWSDFGAEFAVAPWMWLFVMAVTTVPGMILSEYYRRLGEFDEDAPEPAR